MPATYEPIATTTLSSAQASITFSSIASSWTDLRVVLLAKPSANTYPLIRLNSDSGTNYSSTRLSGQGSASSSARVTSSTGISFPGVTPMETSEFSLHTFDILSYAGNTFKTLLITSQNNYATSGGVERMVGLYRSTSAITSILLSGDSANFTAGTTATLYGIKAA